jgi:hypothetical protein
MAIKTHILVGHKGTSQEVALVSGPSEVQALFKDLQREDGGSFDRLTIFTPSRSQRFRKVQKAEAKAEAKPKK